MFMIDLGAESYYSVLGVPPNATAAQIRQARDGLIRELRTRQRREPTRRGELDERQRVINAAGEELVRPARRAQYDQENAHLRFFTVRPAAAPMFTDHADRTAVLHRALRDHLASQGVELPPLSDVDRTDFTADHSPNRLLDELLAQGGRQCHSTK
ncbi:J domain-containing protein [Lentzea rhizosphaerae]|uniref:J domain-containing protein n=1 Tax=Lentzea rhizosphaerae TaxID=2041025 RepID=A0ABV8C6U0_9PSEU